MTFDGDISDLLKKLANKFVHQQEQVHIIISRKCFL